MNKNLPKKTGSASVCSRKAIAVPDSSSLTKTWASDDMAEKKMIIQYKVALNLGGRLLSPKEKETTVKVVIPKSMIEFIA